MYDIEHSIEEDGYIAIGCAGDVLFVVFTDRKEKIRMISARLATEAERRLYYDPKFIIDKGQKPTDEQLQEVMEAKNVQLYLMRTPPNCLLQCIKHFRVQ